MAQRPQRMVRFDKTGLSPAAARTCFLLFLMCFSCEFLAAQKAQVVLLAIDDSGSMIQSDPKGIRLEATSMVALSGRSSDQIGVVKFGSGATWILDPSSTPSSDTLTHALTAIHSSDRWTDFAAVLRVIQDYTFRHSSELKNYDVNVVLMTDGAPDPGPTYPGGPIQNSLDSIEIAKSLGRNGVRLYTIGLGASARSEFLARLSAEANGSYFPAKTAADLRFAFLKTVTHIFSLPAYEIVEGNPQATVHNGSKPELVRAYLFRETNATELDTEQRPLFSTEHIAAYDLGQAPDSPIRIKGPETGASVVVCVRQSLSFVAANPIEPTLLADSDPKLNLKLLAGGEELWGRLFMQEANLRLHLHSADGRDFDAPIYPDPKSKTFRASIPTNNLGEFQASVRMESDYGRVESFLAKVNISSTAVELPSQVTVRYPSFLPATTRRIFGSRVVLKYLLSSGDAKLSFESPPGTRLSSNKFDLAPGKSDTLTVFADEGNPSELVAVPYATVWSNGVQEVTRTGVLNVRIESQGPVQFGLDHWVVLSALALLAVLAMIFLPSPTVKGVLIIERPGEAKRRVLLSRIRSKRIQFQSSRDRDALDSNPVLIRTGRDGKLFVLAMAREKHGWLPRVTPDSGVALRAPQFLTPGSKIVLQDFETTITFHPGN